jgi:hypothetical protein
MMPAPLPQVSCRSQPRPTLYAHYAVRHVHECAAHPASRPRALEKVFRVEVLGDRHARRLDAGQERQPLHSVSPFCVSIGVHIVVPFQLYPFPGSRTPVHAHPYRIIVEAHPIRRSRCPLRPRLCKGRLALWRTQPLRSHGSRSWRGGRMSRGVERRRR